MCAASSKHPVEVVAGQQQAARQFGHARRACAAVGAGEATREHLGVGIAQAGVAGGARDVDAGDAQLCKRFEFTGLADAVLVGVLPDAQLAVHTRS